MFNKICIKFNSIIKLLAGLSFLLVFLVCLQKTVFAAHIDLSNSNYSTILYNSNNGLPTSEANAIAQTSDGFIWIGSYSGLIRYSGNEFERYDSQVGIASVMSLFVDSKDRLWIGTNDSGVALYENGGFVFYGRNDGLRSLSIRSITEDNKHNIILATTQGIAYIDPDGRLNLLSDPHIDDEYINMLTSDGDIVYGVTTNGSIFAIEDLKITYFNEGEGIHSGFSCIYPAPGDKGSVYLGTWGSEIIYANIFDGFDEAETYSVEPQADINMVYPDGDYIWVCADNGIGYFDSNKNYNTFADALFNNSIDFMMEDYENNLWFASSRQGVMEITTSPFVDVSLKAGLDNMVVNSTCIYDDELYIGTDKGLVVLDNDYSIVENELTKLLEGVRIRCIKKTTNNTLWLCTYGDNGLVSFDKKGYRTYTEDNGLASNWVRCMTELSDGTIAVSSSGGVSLIKDGKVVRTYTSADGIENTEILTLCEGLNGDIYAGSDGDGIYIINGDDISHIGMSDGLNSEIILRIKKDPDEDLFWVITSNSISYLKEGRVGTVTKFPYSNNFDIYFSGNGEMWVLSSNGIYVVDKSLMEKDEKIEYSFYNYQCGLPCVATANSRSCLSDDGTLYISGTSGVSAININGADDAVNEIKLAIPFIEVDDELITIGDNNEIVIPADCKRLTIYSYALTYTLHNPHLSYMLEGFDDEAVLKTVHDMEPTTYTNLKGGRYVFSMSLLDSLSYDKKKTVELTIYKTKAFYEHIWFIVLMVILAAGLIGLIAYMYFKHKTAQIYKKQEENRIYINQMTSAFAKSIDLKDKYTNGHSFRVAKYSKIIAENLKYPQDEVDKIYNIALLHDIGKITIPDEILNKPGKLTAEEYEIIKQHASNGYDILKEIEILPDLALGAGFHHERIDGKGYPSGKTGDEIPMVAQIIAVADMFDAMNSTRPYRKKVDMPEIEAELERVAGTQLNADIVAVLLSLIREGKLT